MFGLQSSLRVGAQFFEGVLRFHQDRVLRCEELQLIVSSGRQKSTPCRKGRLVASVRCRSQRRQLRELHEMKLQVVGEQLSTVTFSGLKD
jgi:hypothetical protein